MKATIDFYVEVLGMPLVHAMKVPPVWGPISGCCESIIDMEDQDALELVAERGDQARADRHPV